MQDGAKDINLDGLAVEQLRSLKSDTLRREDDLSQKANEARMKAEVFAKTIASLSERAVLAGAEAARRQELGEAEEAEKQAGLKGEMEALIEENTRRADEKIKLADEYERGAAECRELVKKINDRIKKLNSAVDLNKLLGL